MSVRPALVVALAVVLPGVRAVLAAEVDAQQVEACFASAPAGDYGPHCLGSASDACQTSTPEGQTTIGIAACIGAETAAWDALLNREFRATRDAHAGSAGVADRLVAAQRAWIAFRDADCALAHARWADGSIRGVVAANCLMEMTARRALELRDMRGN